MVHCLHVLFEKLSISRKKSTTIYVYALRQSIRYFQFGTNFCYCCVLLFYVTILSTNYFMELTNFTLSVQSSWFMFHNTSFWKFDIFIISVWPAKSAIVYFYLYFCFIFFIHICPQKIVNNFYTITKTGNLKTEPNVDSFEYTECESWYFDFLSVHSLI